MAKKIKKTADSNIPHLRAGGNAIQLIVDDEPFLVLGGELGNSTASSIEAMKPVWPKLTELKLNTVLVPVYWELLEPKEGKFDFTLVDALLDGARKHKLRLVLLWFGSWKNSMSCYVPAWIKANHKRFPRARLRNGQAMEILSPFYDENLKADIKAFTALMRYLRKKDGKKQTVIFVQVENEIGMLEAPRDYSENANNAFTAAPEDEEIFMARHYARYVNAVAAAGKAEYPLPMYVNAALNLEGQKAGEYPSAGPLPHLYDVWRKEAPNIDFFSPDIYHPVFEDWCEKYDIKGNPLFIPEAGRCEDNIAKAFWAFGQHNAIGFSPFAIETSKGVLIPDTYNILSQLASLILKNQGRDTMAAVSLTEKAKTQQIKLGGYYLKFSHYYTFQWTTRLEGTDKWPDVGGLVISTGKDEFIIAGMGLMVNFSTEFKSEIAGIESIQEGNFVNGKWIGGKWLNGDQSHQGRHAYLGYKPGIIKVRLYRYK
jgi:beta-galactosidase GanA